MRLLSTILLTNHQGHSSTNGSRQIIRRAGSILEVCRDHHVWVTHSWECPLTLGQVMTNLPALILATTWKGESKRRQHNANGVQMKGTTLFRTLVYQKTLGAFRPRFELVPVSNESKSAGHVYGGFCMREPGDDIRAPAKAGADSLVRQWPGDGISRIGGWRGGGRLTSAVCRMSQPLALL
jgi:hypothetical protein